MESFKGVAQLGEESPAKTEGLSTLLEATAAISRSLDIETVVQVAADQLNRLLDVDACSISIWDPDDRVAGQWLIPNAARQRPAYEQFANEQLAATLASGMTLRRPMAAQWLRNDPEIDAGLRARMDQLSMESVLLLKLATQERTMGLVELWTQSRRTFAEHDISLAQLLANQTAITLENARFYQESQRQLRISTLLIEASQVINSSLDLNQIMQSLLAEMNELLNAEALSIALVDKRRNELVFEVAEGIGSDKIVGLRLPSNEGVSGWVMENCIPALVPDTSQDERFSEHGDERTGYTTWAIICAPLHVKGEVLGTIQAINPRKGAFKDDDLRLLVSLANLASSAISNAQQFARTQAAEARYLGLFEDSMDPIILTDQSGLILEANRRACAFLGYKRDELLQMHLSDLHPAEKKLQLGKLETRLSAESGHSITSKAITKDNNLVPVEVHGKRIATSNSVLHQWIYRDISKQVELEQMREDLIAMLFHDLQNPLGNIITGLELLANEVRPEINPDQTSIVGIALRSSKRLQVLVRSLLDISRLEAGHTISDRRPSDVNRLIDEAEEMMRPAMERRGIRLVRQVPGDVPLVWVDRDMMRRVLINLLDNAFKFSPEGGSVELTVSRPSEGQVIKFAMSDHGPGISEGLKDDIFEKFSRAKTTAAPRGLGLGLAFCRLAVEAHGGRIWVEDVPSGGASFHFTVPVIQTES